MHKPNTARRGPTRLAAASSVLLASGLALAGCSSEPEADDPAEVLANYREARNGNDYDALRALYADDAVITGHPLDDSDPPIADVDEILALETERGSMNPDEVTSFVNVEVSGDRATFAHLFFAADGNCYGSYGDERDEVTVRDGKITSYTWDTSSPGSQTCDPLLVAEADVEG